MPHWKAVFGFSLIIVFYSFSFTLQRALAKAVTSVSPSALSPAHALANVFSERKQRTKLGLSKYAAEAAEQAEEHRDKLGIAGKVKDVADVHKTLWPNQPETNQILNLGVLIGTIRPVKPDDPE